MILEQKGYTGPYKRPSTTSQLNPFAQAAQSYRPPIQNSYNFVQKRFNFTQTNNKISTDSIIERMFRTPYPYGSPILPMPSNPYVCVSLLVLS